MEGNLESYSKILLGVSMYESLSAFSHHLDL